MKTFQNLRNLSILGITVMMAFISTPSFAAEGMKTENVPHHKKHVHQYVEGMVSEVKGETVFLETETGTRTLSLKEFEAELVPDVKKGDRFLLEIDEGNQVVDLDQITDSGDLTHAEEHQKLKGNLLAFDREYKTIKIKLADGTEDSYKLKEVAATKMAHVKIGSIVEIEIDEENGLVNDFLVD